MRAISKKEAAIFENLTARKGNLDMGDIFLKGSCGVIREGWCVEESKRGWETDQLPYFWSDLFGAYWHSSGSALR